jgi:hypothetical protein
MCLSTLHALIIRPVVSVKLPEYPAPCNRPPHFSYLIVQRADSRSISESPTARHPFATLVAEDEAPNSMHMDGGFGAESQAKDERVSLGPDRLLPDSKCA